MAELTAVEKLKKWVADNLQTLQAAKVESIIGEYSGCGDEGNWGGVSFDPAGGWKNLDEKLRDEVGELLESACGQLESPGYEVGDGGGGSITLNVSTGKLLHSEYYYETVREYTTEDSVV
jgi:hypothetical protein